MTLEQINQALSPLVAEWPVGSMVYDRITGKKGMVMGYQCVAPLLAQLRVDYGDGGMTSELPMSLTTTKPAEEDGDEWKEGAER